jgi:hypothetical protein
VAEANTREKYVRDRLSELSSLAVAYNLQRSSAAPQNPQERGLAPVPRN